MNLIDRVSYVCYTYSVDYIDYQRRNALKKSVEYIIEKMKEYAQVPSLTYEEDDFLDYLAKKIEPKKHTLYDMDRYLVYKYEGETKWLILAHTDRISVEKYDWRVEDDVIHGQLDNGISVAICTYLIQQGYPVDIAFTTQEETCHSAGQITDIYKALNREPYVVDMDIDVSLKHEEVMRGAISLRDRDNMVGYCKELVDKVRAMCDKNKIDYIKKDNDWLICQIGTAIKEDPELKGMYLGLPIGNYHSHEEYMPIKCIERVLDLFTCIKNKVMHEK